MKKYKAYLIDLDGTMYRGSEKIEEASDFVKALEEKNIPYLFVTNNSTQKPDVVAKKLMSFDIPATPEKVYTSSLATADYIYEENKQAKIYMIGEEGLRVALEEKGFTLTDKNPDYVVVGLDREINYEKLGIACNAVRNGAKFISTNGDIAIPTEKGFMPGNGSITSVITVSTRTQPIFIGKPESIIMSGALHAMNVEAKDALMVGDNYDTDILAGIHANIDTLLVHTGVTKKHHLEDVEEQPTYVAEHLREWIEHM